jgi:hypothetical protein
VAHCGVTKKAVKMTFTIKQARPVDDRLLIGIGGPQNSGKTTSALRMASGIVEGTGKRICIIDTEKERALRYAANFDFDHLNFEPPFTSLRYLEAIQQADAAGYGVIIVDSTSHEHDGPGGVLEQHEEILTKMAGNDYHKREKCKFTAWIQPKQARNRLIQFGLQRVKAHVILCFRAKEKIAMIKNKEGKLDIVNDGYQIIGGEEFGYEMSIMFMLPPNSKGKPDWSEKASRINDLDGHLTKMLHETTQISEETGRKIRQICSVKKEFPIDETLESLKQRGRDVAVNGGKALDEWLKALPKEDKVKLSFFGAEIRKIADEVDNVTKQ